MSETQGTAPGTIIGLDLTVPDAESVRDFYADVIGWEVEPFAMDGYDDYFMKSPATGQPVSGICHARGENAGLPAQWLNYVVVENLDASLQRCTELGGSVVSAIRGNPGEQRYCVIQDPAGAVIALMEIGGS